MPGGRAVGEPLLRARVLGAAGVAVLNKHK